MRIMLNLDEKTLEKLQELANAEKRSRKNFMELALVRVADGNNPILEIHEKTSVQNFTDDKTTNVAINIPEKERIEADILKRQDELNSLNGVAGNVAADRRRFLKNRLETLRTELSQL